MTQILRLRLLRTQVLWDAPAFLVMLSEVKHLSPVGDVASEVDTHLPLPGQIPSEDSEPALNRVKG